MNKRTFLKRSAFTLIELLVVIAVVALLIAILIPVLNIAKRQTRILICGTNQKQLVYGLNSYMNNNDHQMPYHPTMDNIAQTARHRPYELNWHTSYNDGNVYTVSDALLRNENDYPYLGQYLQSYIPDTGVFNCPETKFKNNTLWPPMESGQAPMGTYNSFYLSGAVAPLHCTYALLWRYPSRKNEPGCYDFQGPRKGGDKTKLVVMDALFWGEQDKANIITLDGPRPDSWYTTHWMKDAERGTPYFRIEGGADVLLDVKLNAGYIDGHVSSFHVQDSKRVRFINIYSRLPYYW